MNRGLYERPGCLGDAQRGGERKLIGRAFDERLEGVARIHAAARSRDRRTASAGVVARLDRGVGNLLDELLLGGVGDLHLDDELAVGCADFFQGVANQRQVARQDAVAGVPIWGTDAQHRRVAVERSHILEGREPDRFGHLGSQQLGYGCPQLIMVAHLHLPS